MNAVGPTARLAAEPGRAPDAGFAARLRVWHVWIALAGAIVLISLPFTFHIQVQDPDNFMRLLEVRDWLAGQSWWDVHQYRMNPPTGAEMHWTRLVDLPIAGLIALLDLLLPYATAETIAVTAVPLFQLLIALLLIERIVRALGGSYRTALVAVAIVPLFPLLITNFLPMRIDHHGWQGIAALAVVLLMLRRGYGAAFAAGWIAAAWLTISLEGTPLAAAFGALFALRYCLHGTREHEAYLAGLAIGGPLIFAGTHLPGEWPVAYCDILSWPHFLAFAAAAIAAAGSRLLPAESRRHWRWLSLLPLPLVAIPAVVLPLGACAVSPMSALDPMLHEKWFMNIKEGISIVHQAPSVIGMLLWTFVIVGAGAWRVLRETHDKAARENWALYTLATLAACGVSLLAMRAGLTAQLMAVPFAAHVLLRLLPRARAIGNAPARIVATVACLGLTTPAFASALLRPFDHGTVNVAILPPPGGNLGRCDYTQLNSLPKSKLFAPLDLGPEILVNSPHSVVMGGYHRNQTKMREVFDALSGPLEGARQVIRANGAQYVVACSRSADIAVYLTLGHNNLAERLYFDRPPAWLEPVPQFAGSPLRVWRVK